MGGVWWNPNGVDERAEVKYKKREVKLEDQRTEGEADGRGSESRTGQRDKVQLRHDGQSNRREVVRWAEVGTRQNHWSRATRKGFTGWAQIDVDGCTEREGQSGHGEATKQQDPKVTANFNDY